MTARQYPAKKGTPQLDEIVLGWKAPAAKETTLTLKSKRDAKRAGLHVLEVLPSHTEEVATSTEMEELLPANFTLEDAVDLLESRGEEDAPTLEEIQALIEDEVALPSAPVGGKDGLGYTVLPTSSKCLMPRSPDDFASDKIDTHVMEALVQSIAKPAASDFEIPAEWTFHNKDIADNFDKHVREQLPWYDLSTSIVAHFGRHYLAEGSTMYDIGASTGNVTLALKSEITSRKVRVISLDNSEEMAKVWRGVGCMEVADVRTYPFERYDFAVCFLLLMFLPPADQRRFVQELYSKLNVGGALVIFDKTDKFSGYLATVVHRLTMAGKMSTGVPAEEILKKEMSLAGVQRPIDVNHLLFNDMGASEVFRFGEFAGWIITK